MDLVVETIRAALLLPEDSTDADVMIAVKGLMADYLLLKRRQTEDAMLLIQLAQARNEISNLAAELRALKAPDQKG